MRLLGYRLDPKGEQMLLLVHRGKYYLRYKGEDSELNVQYRMVPEGTYLDNVHDIPYFVLDNRVYPIKSFESLHDRIRK